MSMPKLTPVLFAALLLTPGLTACKKNGGGGGKKSERLRWVKKPTTGTTEEGGKVIKIPGLGVDFYTPDVLYVYKDCTEASHTPEGPDKAWVPVIRCTSPFDDEEEEDWGEVTDEEEDDGTSSGGATLTIYVTDKSDMIINERSTASYELQYQQAGFEVEDVHFFDEYLSKPNRRGIEIIAHTINPDNGYPETHIRRFMFPRQDVVFIAHIDYPYANDASGINSDWERILWNFQFVEDGPLFQ